MRTSAAVPGEKGVTDIRLIRLGRREHRSLGDIRPLADSIRDGGLRHPVTISPGFALILGRRRLAAYEYLRQSHVPYRAVGTVPEALAVIAEENADSRQALPMTIAEAVYRDWAMRDELEWWPRAGQNKGLPGTRVDHRDALAGAAGLNGSQYARACTVILAAEGFCRKMNYLHALEDEAAIAAGRDAAKLLETSDLRVIDGAYRQYRTALRPPEAAPPATAAEVDAALARLSGTVSALSALAPPPGAAPVMLQRWDDVLTMQVIRPLMQFRKARIRGSGEK